MIRLWVELSAENLDLARAEAEGAAKALGGNLGEDAEGLPARCVAVEMARPGDGRSLAARLALARRVLVPIARGVPEDLERALRAAGGDGRSAAMRELASSGRGPEASPLLRLGKAYRQGGGTIRLENPDLRFWLAASGRNDWTLLREEAEVDRAAFSRRAMPRLPFRRPVSLSPLKARAAVNLARVAEGQRVADPFVGTGALLLEAALLGARVRGVDLDPVMARGALRNFEALGLTPESVAVADSGAVDLPDGLELDALVTDPPYGRASGSGGEAPEELVARVLPRWASRLRRGGRAVVILPGGADPLPEPFRRVGSIPDRVHRSLTREFRVYARRGEESDAN